MLYGFNKVNINPKEAAYTVGFSVPKEKCLETKLDLFMRTLYLKDNNNEIVIVALDNLDCSHDSYLSLKEIVNNKYKDALVLVTCSHTHYAPSIANQFPMLFSDETYLKQVKEALKECINNIETHEIEGKVSYNYKPFNKVGSTRISSKSDENVYAGTLSIYNKEERIGNIVFYNCHPTEDAKVTDYFSSAYVGACLKNLETKYPNEFFIFLQGCCGDVSSRFTRKERSFKQTLEFGEILSDCFIELMNNNKPNNPLNISYNSVTYDFKYDIKEIPEIPQSLLENLKEAEKQELLIGLEELKKYRSYPNLPKVNVTNLNRVSFGPYKLFFNPFELFTDYNKLIDKEKTLLVNYTNGAIAYLLPLDNNAISYEYFLETTSNEDKHRVKDAIDNL